MQAVLLATLLTACSFQAMPGETDSTDSGGDGVADNDDNCPSVPNPDQRDHDGDGLGDACDTCPHRADPTNADNDRDGIGDVCDPNPTRTDHLVWFEGFYDPPGTRWTPTAGRLDDWGLVNEAGVLQQQMLDGNRHQLDLAIDVQAAYVEAGVVVDREPPEATPALRSATVVVGSRQVWSRTMNREVEAYGACGPRREAANNATQLVAGIYVDEDLQPITTATTANWAGGFLGNRFEVKIQAKRQGRDGTLVTCKATAAGSTPLDASVTAQANPTGKIGLRTYGTTASFDYIFVVETAR